jgi:hypothetical protein
MLLRAIRDGDWATGQRLQIYPLILLALSVIAAIVVVVASRGGMGPNDLPLGADFGQVWVAGREALAGAPDAPFDFARHAAAQRATFGPDVGLLGWHYPPYFLGVAALLARLPYLQALAVWQIVTLGLYLLSILALLAGSGLSRRTALVAALAYPAVFVNLGHGQNGFLTAALLGGGFFFLDRRPALAGALFGLLAYKPQFALLLPLVLAIGGRWRTLAGAAATVAAVTAASLALFGVASWRAFFDNLGVTRAVLEQGAPGFEKIQSVFAAVRLLGGGVSAAWLLQGLVVVCVVVALVRLLRSGADARIKAAATIEAMFLATPYSLDYDMMALAPALALLLAHGLEKGFQPFEKSALAFAYVAPLFARPVAMALLAPVGVVSVAALFAATVRNRNHQ